MAALVVLVLLLSVTETMALDNGLSAKPPLGWNSWNWFGCDINEAVIRTAADRLVELGLTAAGYTYLNLDDCWQSHARSTDGRLQPDAAKFPAGMAALAAHVHDEGLKFGIYSDAGSLTCAGYPGSRHHEEVDAATFAAWGVDYLKYDNCYAQDYDIRERYSDMRDALNKTGRPIYYSMCNWGVAEPWEWAHDVGARKLNSWRTYEDIFPHWPSMLRALDYGAAGLAQYARPGGWNDPDMLEVGVAQWSLAQQRSHFALWALVKAPLLIGANLAAIGADSLAILKATELIAVNQDELGVAADIIYKGYASEIWAGPLSGNQRAVVLFNRHSTWWPVTIRVTWAQLGYEATPGFKAVVRDLYSGRDLGVFEDGFEAQVSSHDVMAIRVTPLGLQAVTPGGEPAESEVMAGSEWRPWSDARAARLQARMRDAARQARWRAAVISRLVNFVLAHRYSLGFAAAVLLGAMVVGVVRWVVGRARRRVVRYQAVPHHSEMSFDAKGYCCGTSRSASSSPIMWEALPSSTSASDSDGSPSSDEGAV